MNLGEGFKTLPEAHQTQDIESHHVVIFISQSDINKVSIRCDSQSVTSEVWFLDSRPIEGTHGTHRLEKCIFLAVP